MTRRRLLRDPEISADYITCVVAERYEELVWPTRSYADFSLDASLNTAELAAKVLALIGYAPANSPKAAGSLTVIA